MNKFEGLEKDEIYDLIKNRKDDSELNDLCAALNRLSLKATHTSDRENDYEPLEVMRRVIGPESWIYNVLHQELDVKTWDQLQDELAKVPDNPYRQKAIIAWFYKGKGQR